MDIEHCDCLSWFLRKDKSHEQDGEKLPPAAMPQTETASSDPAMAFEPSIGRTGDHSTRLKIGSVRRCRDEQRTNPVSASKRANTPRKSSATNTQPFDQRLVTRRVDAGEIVEELPALGYELEQSPPGVVVLHVGLEMLGEAGDALREDRHLHFRRTGVAGFGRIGLNDLGLAARRDRHRDVPFLSGFRSAAGPGCRPARSLQVVYAALQRFRRMPVLELIRGNRFAAEPTSKTSKRIPMP